MPNKFIQPPDAGPTGLSAPFDQSAARVRKLADDWTCGEDGEISKVTLWVSFLDDALPKGGVAGVRLGVRADAPADPGRPGAPLAQWDLEPSELSLSPHVGPVTGRFWDPATGQALGADTQVRRLDCFVPKGQRFIQRRGATYWLCAFVVAGEGAAPCGWRTFHMAPGAAAWTDDELRDPPTASWAAMR